MIELVRPGHWRVDYAGFPLAIEFCQPVVYAPGFDCDRVGYSSDGLEHQRFHDWYGTPCPREHSPEAMLWAMRG